MYIYICIYIYVYVYIYSYTYMYLHKYSQLPLKCLLRSLKSQFLFSFSRSLLQHFSGKRPMRLRLEIEIEDTPNTIPCT